LRFEKIDKRSKSQEPGIKAKKRQSGTKNQFYKKVGGLEMLVLRFEKKDNSEKTKGERAYLSSCLSLQA